MCWSSHMMPRIKTILIKESFDKKVLRNDLILTALVYT